MIKLINGDCLKEMKNVKDGSIDMVLCDLPYGTTACKWDTIIPFDKLWEQYNRIIKPNGVIALFGSEPFSSYLRLSNIKNYKYDWKWDKVNGGNPLIAKKRPLNIYEDIIIFYKKAGKYNPIMEEKEKEKIRPLRTNIKNTSGLTGLKSFTTEKNYNNNLKYPLNKLVFNNKSKELNSSKRVHPTQKPVELLEYLIKTYTNEGELILDNTMGSGSTGVAALNTNRNFIGIELDKNYFEIAQQRIKEAEHDNL